LLRRHRLVSDARRNVRLYSDSIVLHGTKDQGSKISTQGKSTVTPPRD